MKLLQILSLFRYLCVCFINKIIFFWVLYMNVEKCGRNLASVIYLSVCLPLSGLYAEYCNAVVDVCSVCHEICT